MDSRFAVVGEKYKALKISDFQSLIHLVLL